MKTQCESSSEKHYIQDNKENYVPGWNYAAGLRKLSRGELEDRGL